MPCRSHSRQAVRRATEGHLPPPLWRGQMPWTGVDYFAVPLVPLSEPDVWLPEVVPSVPPPVVPVLVSPVVPVVPVLVSPVVPVVPVVVPPVVVPVVVP